MSDLKESKTADDPFDRPLSGSRSCGNCRYHSKLTKPKPISVADGDLELVAWEDEPGTMMVCQHPRLAGRAREIGFSDTDPEPGADCADFQPGEKKAIDPELEKLLNRRGL